MTDTNGLRLTAGPSAHTAPPLAAYAAFEEFYAREAPAMIRLAGGLVDSREAAEEIVQDAFERTLLAWGRLDRPGAFVRTCVVNGARSMLRRRRILRRPAARINAESMTSPEPVDAELLAALSRLTPQRRVALVLRFYGDMSEADIAEAMNVRPGTVKSLVSRGLSDLRKVIPPMSNETSSDLGSRLGVALARRAETSSFSIAPVEAVERGARRRRTRQRTVAGATCVALAAAIAVPITLRATDDNPDVGAAPTRGPALPAYAMLDESVFGRPTQLGADAGGAAYNGDVVDVSVWRDGNGATLVIRNVTPAAIAEALHPPSDLPSPTEAVAAETMPTATTAAAAAVETGSSGQAKPQLVTVRGVDAYLTELAFNQWLIELGAHDQQHVEIIGRGIGRARLLADVEAMEGRPLAASAPYELVGRAEGPRWGSPTAPWSQVAYGVPSDNNNSTWVSTTKNESAVDVGIDGVPATEPLPVVDIGGRPTKIFRTEYGATIASWVDPATKLLVGVVFHRSSAATMEQIEEAIGHVRLVDVAEFQAASLQRSAELAQLPIVVTGSVDGADVSTRSDGTIGALCITDRSSTSPTCVNDWLSNGQPQSVAAHAIVDGRWVIFGYFGVGDLGNGSFGATPEQVGAARFDTPAGPGEEHYAPAGQGQVFVVRLPDAATSVSTDYGNYYGGMSGEAARPEVASTLG